MTAFDEQVEVVDGEVVQMTLVPWTGEVIVLRDATNAQLAEALDEVRRFEAEQLKGLKRDLQDEILMRMDHEASWTIRLESGVTLTGDGPNRSEWDVPSLQGVLSALEDEGLVSHEAAAKGIREKVTYEAAAAGLNALLKLGGEVRARIEACRLPSSRPRSVRVTGGRP